MQFAKGEVWDILVSRCSDWSGNIEFSFELSYVRRLDADLEPSPRAAHLLKLACNPFIYSK